MPPPLPPDAQLLLFVLSQYGAAMMQVQAWEGTLAALVGAANLKPRTGRPVNLERELRGATRRTWHLLHKASASELRKMLTTSRAQSSIPDGLLTEIGNLIRWRDFLAHRYLRSRLFSGGALRPKPEHGVELFKLSKAFNESSSRISETTAAILASIPPPTDIPDETRRTLEQWAWSIAQAQPYPFTDDSSGGTGDQS